MNSNLSYLIRLAKKTNSKLIIHDSVEDNDVVVMDLFEFEMLHDMAYGFEDFDCRRDVRDLSEGELLDQINRDIAIWRANKEMDEKWEKESVLEEQVEKEGPFDPFAEVDYHPAEWHQAGSILGEKYKDKPWVEDDDDDDENDNEGYNFSEDYWDSNDDEEENDYVDDIPNFIFEENDKDLDEDVLDDSEDDIKVEDILVKDDFKTEEERDKNFIGDVKYEIPFVEESDNIMGEWEEESLSDDEPIFLEEPI